MGAVWLHDGCLSESDIPSSAQKCKCKLLIVRSHPTGSGHLRLLTNIEWAGYSSSRADGKSFKTCADTFQAGSRGRLTERRRQWSRGRTADVEAAFEPPVSRRDPLEVSRCGLARWSLVLIRCAGRVSR